MSNAPTIHNARDYVNYVFNISTRGVAEVTSEIFGLSSTVQNVLGNLAFKTSEYLSHAEATTIGFGIAAAGAYVGATKRAIEFQQATANVEAISGKQLIGSEVGAQAMEMSNKFGMAIEDMTSGLEALARAGVTAKSSINALLESGTQMAKFEGTDLETSMNDLISTVNLLTSDMNVNSEAYAKRVADVNQHIISTSESSPINAHDIINSLQHVGGYASSTNLDQDDLFAVIAQLGAKGTKGEITGTSLRAFISAGQKDTAQRALSKVGLNVTDLWDEAGESILSISQMKDVLDDALEAKGYSKQQKLEFYSDFVGYKQANQIMKIDTSEVEHYRNAIDNAMNLTDKMNITLGTVQGNWSQIVSTSVNFMTKVGSKMLPIINAILIPIKMIVGFLDKMPFADWIVGAGLGFVAIKGIAKAVQILVPTMLTFIYKFTDLKKDSFSIHNIFEQWVEDLKQAKEILTSMKDKNEMERIVDEREAEHTNKYLFQLNEKDAINEYMRQKFGTRTKMVGNQEKEYYVWDKMGKTQKEYYRNKYRPSEDIIKNFIDHRKKWFDEQWDNADNDFRSRSDEWPNARESIFDDVFDESNYHARVLTFYDSFQTTLDKIIDNQKKPNDSRKSDIKYNKSNREKNAEASRRNIFSFGHYSSEQLDDEANFYKTGSIKNDNRIKTYGRYNANDNVIKLSSKKINNAPYSQKDEIALRTFAHEYTHATTSPIDRKGKIGGTESVGKQIWAYGPKMSTLQLGSEIEANIVEKAIARAFGFDSNNSAFKQKQKRLEAFGAEMKPEYDIDMNRLSILVSSLLTRDNFDGISEILQGDAKTQMKSLSERMKKGNKILKEYSTSGVSFDELNVNKTDFDTLSTIQSKAQAREKNIADVFDLAPSVAAQRIEDEKSRMRKKMDDFRNDEDIVRNAYKKNILTSAMTEDGKKFAIEKNQRQLYSFMEGNGFKGGLLKGQWSKMQEMFANATYETSPGAIEKDTLLQSFAGLKPEEFLSQYESLKRDVDKFRVIDALLNFGQRTASDLIDTRTLPNASRRGMITTADYKNISEQLGIDFTGAKNNKERYNILKDYADKTPDNVDKIVDVLMQHENPLARTLESATKDKNIAFLETLKREGYNTGDLIDKYRTGREFQLYENIRERFFEKDENGNYLSDEQQAVGQIAKKFWKDWAEFGQAAQYELGLHFEEIEKLAKRAEVSVNEFNGNVGSNKQPQISGEDIRDKSHGNTFSEPNKPNFIMLDPSNLPVIYDNTSRPPVPYDGGPKDASDKYRDKEIKDRVDKINKVVDSFHQKMNSIFDRVVGHYEEGTKIDKDGQAISGRHFIGGNRASQFIYDKVTSVEPDRFSKQVDKINNKINSATTYLQLWQDAFTEVGQVFPPFIVVGMALTGVIETLTAVTTTLTLIESTLTQVRTGQGLGKIFSKFPKMGEAMKVMADSAGRIFGGLISGIDSLGAALMGSLNILGPIIAAILAVVAALKLSQDAHDKYLEKLKKEQKEVVSEDKANQALYENVKQQRRAGYRNKAAKNFGDIQYEVAQQKLHASNLKRQINAIKVAEQESDALWGTYGTRAAMQKSGLGFIAGGDFKSTADQYTGTSEQIRKIKESTVANPFATGAQKQAAAYFDANQTQIAMIDNYKSELGELYDTESKLIRMYGSKETARNSAIFKKSVEKFAEKVGIDVETAKKMLDYMQVEHNVETASTAMQAQADAIAAETEQKAIAAANGADMDLLLHGSTEEQTKLMVQGQADMIKQQAADSLWWKAAWGTVTSLFWQFMSPITLIYNLLVYISSAVSAIAHSVGNPIGTIGQALGFGTNKELENDLRNMDMAGKGMQNAVGDFFMQGPEAKKTRMYIEGYNKIQNEDLYSKGMSSISDLDRADYGNGGGSLSRPNVVPATPKDYQKDTTNTTNTKAQTTPQSTSWWDALFKPQDNTVTQKASTKTASAQTETFKAQTYQQGYNNLYAMDVSGKNIQDSLGDMIRQGTEAKKAQTYQQGYNNLYAMDVSGKNIQDSLGDMIRQGTEAKKAQTYQQGYNKIQKVEVTNQDDSTTLQNSTVGAAAGGLEAKAGAALGTAVAGPIGTAVGRIAGGIIGEETMRQWGDAIGGTLGWVRNQLWNLVSEQGKAAWNTITKSAGDAWGTITKTARSAWKSIIGTLSGFGKWLNDATVGVFGQIWDTFVGTNEQSNRLVKGALGYTPIGVGINLASDVDNWLTGSGDNTNTSSYQPQTAEATQKSVEKAQKNKRTQGTKTSIVIENININTEDDPEKIKTALMNLIIELQEQVSPRMVSRTIGEPAQASSDTEEDSKTKEEEEALKKQQSGSSTTTTLS